MQLIELEQTPQQTFRITLGGYPWQLTFRTIGEATYATIMQGEEILATSVLCCPGVPLLQYPFIQNKGNFIFDTQDNKYPFYLDFGKTCNLYYLEA